MDALSLVAGGTALTFIATSWARIKHFGWRICNTFIQDVVITDPATRGSVTNYLVANFERVGLYDRMYDSRTDFLQAENRNGLVAYEYLGDHSVWFRKGWRLLYLSVGKDEKTGAVGSKRLLALRGTFDFDALVEAAVAEVNQRNWTIDARKSRRFFVRHIPDPEVDGKAPPTGNAYAWQYEPRYRTLGRKPSEIGLAAADAGSKVDRLFFPEPVKRMIEEVRIWAKSREVYRKLGIPWKRGWLLHGPGGTGKSALAAAFAHDLDMPIFVYNLAEMDNLSFMAEWRKMLTNTPCVALIEDFDNVFHGRTNISGDAMGFGRMFSGVGRKKAETAVGNGEEAEVGKRFGNRLSFDVILNCLDGVERSEGLFTIITTNKVEHIDEALGRPVALEDGSTDFVSTRPGRIDKAIELTFMEQGVKERMARRMLADTPDLLAEVLAGIEANPIKETPAQFQDRCGQMALRRYWEGRTPPQAA